MAARDEIVRTYWRHHELERARRAPRLALSDTFWAREEVLAAVGAPDPDAVALLTELADNAPDDEALIHLGAGPVEELVHAHGAEVADELEAAARVHPRLRAALANVWFDEAVDESVLARLRWVGPQ